MHVLALRLSASAKPLFCVPHVDWPLSIAVISIDCAATSSFGGIQCTSRLLWLDPLHLLLSLFFCASRVLRFYEARVSPLLFNVSVWLILCSPWDRPSTNLSCDITSPVRSFFGCNFSPTFVIGWLCSRFALFIVLVLLHSPLLHRLICLSEFCFGSRAESGESLCLSCPFCGLWLI